MKNSILIFITTIIGFLISSAVWAQAPDQFNYQAVLRNNGEIITEGMVNLRFTIHQGSPNGAAVYQETQNATTDQFGHLNLSVGTGTALNGTFANIDWGNGSKYLQVEVDYGPGFQDMGTQRLLSVPYALYAGNSSSGGSNPTGEAGGDLTGTYPNPEIAEEAVTSSKIAAQGVKKTNIKNAAVTSVKIANQAVTSSKITDGAVTAAKLNQMNAANGQVLQWDGATWTPITLSGDSTGDDWGSQTTQTTDRLTGNGTSGNPLDIAQQGAGDGQVLKWNGSIWEPADDETGSGGGGGDDWGTQVVEADVTLDGEGTTTDPLGVADNAITTNKLANNAVTSEKLNQMGATNDQFLKWNGTAWVPGNVSGGTGDNWGSQVVESNTTMEGEGTASDPLGVADNAITVNKLANNAVTQEKLDQMGASNNQVLKWNNTNNTWEPADDETGSGGGSGDDWGNQIVQTSDRLSGEGTTANPLDIATQGATSGQVLKFDGTNWVPGTDDGGSAGTTYTAGDGIDISGTNEISADLGTDISTDELQNAAVTGEKIDQMSAGDGQVLKWDGSTWSPADDETATSGSGDDWGSQVVEADISLDGEGTTANPLGIADNAIATVNLQDAAVKTDKIDDGAINGDKLNQMSAGDGQVLKWNNTNNTWEPADDETGSGSGSGDDWGTQVVEADVTLDGEGTTADPLGVADNAITTNKLANNTVTSEKLNQMGASSGQVLTFDGTNWTPDNITGGSGDNWGSQVAETDATLTGDGTTGSELGLAQNGATDGQILSWDDANSNWTPTDLTANGDAFFEADADQINFADNTNFGKDFLVNSEEIGINNPGSTEYKMMFLPSKEGAFRVGRISVDYWDSNNIGSASMAFGGSTKASGDYSTAMGSLTKASGDYATAMGNNTEASGETSIAMGNNTEASGLFSTAVGSFSEASGDWSTAMGSSTEALAYFSTAMGESTEASGEASTAMGSTTIASGKYSTALGGATVASGKGSAAIGDETKASGIASTAMGYLTKALEDYSTAMGYKAEASGENSTAMGASTIASDFNSTAMGYFTEASGYISTAMGANTEASGDFSTAMGESTEAIGEFSTTMGNYSEASGNYSIAMGAGPIASGIASVAMGADTEASGNESTAMGSNTEASGSYSTAMGKETTASGAFSTAMGNNTKASAPSSIAMGQAADALAPNSTVIGREIRLTSIAAGSMFLGDASRSGTGDVWSKTGTNRFYAVFDNGYVLHTNGTESNGVLLAHNDNSWSTISDSTKKENIKLANGTYFLESIKKMELGSWNYIGQDPEEYRHWGPMAQDMYKYFGHDGIGTIGNDTTIATADIDGVMMISIQQLARENDSLKTKNELLTSKMTSLKQKVAKQKQAMLDQKQLLEAKIENYAEEKQVLEAKVEHFDQVNGEMEERMSKLEGLLLPEPEKQYSKR